MTAAARARAPSWMLIAGALTALYLVLFAIVGSSMFGRAPGVISLAVTFDLTVTATLIVWWLGVRRKTVSPWVAVAVFSWGVAAARRWVPQAPLSALFVVGGALEVVTVGWLLLRIRRVARVARQHRDEGPIGALEAGLRAARFPARVAGIVATELVTGWLALTGWFRKPGPGTFAMRSTGWILTVGVLGFLVIVESGLVHYLLDRWSPLAAWLATGSSIYTLLWVTGDAQAIRLYPVAVDHGMLRLRVGVRWRGQVALTEIVAIDEIQAVPAGAVNLSVVQPTVLVTLRAPIEIRGLLGRKRTGDRIALTIDDPRALRAAVGPRSAA